MNENSKNRFSLISLLAALTVIAIGTALFTNFVPLSAVVATIGTASFVVISYQHLSDWQSFSMGKRIWRICTTILFALVVFAFSAAWWMSTQVQSNRLTTIYKPRSAARDLSVSVFRGKGTHVTVSGSLPSRESFHDLRTELLGDFADDPYLGIQWNVTTDHETIEGSDRDLFPEEYDSENRRITM